MNLYRFAAANDPHGLLQRRQVDYIGKALHGDGWPGIDQATAAQVKSVVIDFKRNLVERFPDQDWSQGDIWTTKDDIAFQELIDDVAGFPGHTYVCLDYLAIAQAIEQALAQFTALGGKLHSYIDRNLLLALAMHESTLNIAASAYGWSATDPGVSLSTAAGLTQVNRTTYNDFSARDIFTKAFKDKYGSQWNEESLTTDPVHSLVTGLFILQNKGATPREMLEGYYGGAGKESYAEKILKGKAYLDDVLHGRRLDQLSEEEGPELLKMLDKKVH
jgi:hypothetical protein